MKISPSQKIKIGLFTALGLLALILGIFFIGNQKNMFSNTFTCYGIFRNVSGLQVGNNARFAGINVGVVQDINIESDSTVRVDLAINNNVKKFIKNDAKLSIGSDGLMGDKLVIIAPGVSSTEVIHNNGKLTAVNPLDIDKIVTKLAAVADNAQKITGGLSEIVDKVNHGHGSLSRLINNDDMAKSLDATVKQAKSTMQNVHTTTTTLNTDLKAAQSNFLLRGFFKKKKKKAEQDSIKKAQGN